MSLQPLLNAPLAIQLHAFAAMFAFVIGLVQFAGPKGTGIHRVLGYAWVSTMILVATTSFWIHEIRQFGGFSLIHLLSIFTLCMVPLAVYAARRGNIKRHRMAMIQTFCGALIIAGLFTLLPGRIMHDVLFLSP